MREPADTTARSRALRSEISDSVLSVQNLRTYFHTPAGTVKAVDDVSFELFADDVLAIVGESGSGKSVTAQSVMKLVPLPPGEYAAGVIDLQGIDLLALNERAMEDVRGKRIAMIFQNARSALNPSFTIGFQMTETLKRHDPSLSRTQREERTGFLLCDVGFPDPERICASYPHQLSGGMCQRMGIAMCMACEPDILIADEPTTALDVVVQAIVLKMLKRLHEERNVPIIVITHDFGVVSSLANRVIVMYAGQIQEQGDVDQVLSASAHPYTRALIKSIPDPDKDTPRLYQIAGQPPDLMRLPPGCSFAERCEHVSTLCRTEKPALLEAPDGSLARCHLYGPRQTEMT